MVRKKLRSIGAPEDRDRYTPYASIAMPFPRPPPSFRPPPSPHPISNRKLETVDCSRHEHGEKTTQKIRRGSTKNSLTYCVINVIGRAVVPPSHTVSTCPVCLACCFIRLACEISGVRALSHNTHIGNFNTCPPFPQKRRSMLNTHTHTLIHSYNTRKPEGNRGATEWSIL